MSNPPYPSQGRRWSVPFPDEEITRDLIAALRRFERSMPGPVYVMKHMIDRYGGLKIEIFAREHPPPHFHVSCANDEATFSIADCRQLSGGFRREYRVIQDWHAKNRRKLVDTWNSLRPADCPVGPFRE